MLEDLQNLPQWVVRFADKVPLRPIDGKKASVSNPDDWTDFATACACCAANPTLGLGFVLTESDPFSLIDLDDASDPKFHLTPDEVLIAVENQRKISNAFDSYSEVSPSGRGLHIIVKGTVPSGKRKQCVEVYSSGRYMTVTGNVYRDLPINDCQALLTQLWAEMGGKEASRSLALVNQEQTRTDEEVCRVAGLGDNGNGELFTTLYSGQWQGVMASASEADLALCNILAFYSDNAEQVGRIFRGSKLANLDKRRIKKTQRDEYLFHEKWGIVTKAFDRKQPMLDLSQLAAKVQAKIEVETTKKILNDWTVPPGLVGQVAEFIYANAVNPVKEVALAAALAFVAGICGRAYNYSRTGLNQYIILLANSGGGKEGASQGMDRLAHAIREQVPSFDQFIGPSNIASPQALIKHFQDSPCFVSHLEEIGHFLQKICGKYAKGNEVELRGTLLKLFSKSGAKQSFKSTIYSDRQKNVPVVDSPALTLFGDSTHREFYKALDEDNVAEGLVSRFTVIEASDQRPTYNQENNTVPLSPELVWKLGALAKRCLELEQLNSVINVAETPEANAFHTAFREECADTMYEDRESPLANIWNRAHLRMLRLAALLAVGVNPDTPIVTIAEVKWAKTLVVHGIEMVSKRFEHGEVGERSFALEQQQALRRALLKYFNLKWSEDFGSRYNITKEMHKAKVVTHRYLQIMLAQLACYRNDRNSSLALRTAIEEVINAGSIERIDMKKVRDSGRQGLAYQIVDVRDLK